MKQSCLQKVGTGIPHHREEALGNKRGNQTQEQRYCSFSNLVIEGKLWESVCFVCDRETGGWGYPTNGRLMEWYQRIKPSWSYWLESIHPIKKPRYIVGSVRGNACFYPCGYYGGIGRVCHSKTFGGCRARCYRFRGLTGVVTKIRRQQQKNCITVKSFVDWLAN